MTNFRKIRVKVFIAGFGISGIEPSGSATVQFVRWMLGKWVVRMRGGWNWLRIVSDGEL